MAKLIYSMIASADGYVEDATGDYEWAAPDDEVFRFVNDLERPVGTYLYGRRMYQTMLYWETAHTLRLSLRIEPGNDVGPDLRSSFGSDEYAEVLKTYADFARIFNDAQGSGWQSLGERLKRSDRRDFIGGVHDCEGGG